MKKLVFLLALLLLASNAFAASQFYSPTGLNHYNEEEAYEGYNLWHPLSGMQETFLMDMNGQVVHSWPMDADRWTISNSVHMLEEGKYKGLLLRTQSSHYIGKFRIGTNGGNPATGTSYHFVDWKGNDKYVVRHPYHTEPTEAEMQDIFGLTDAQMQDQSAIDNAVANITTEQTHEINKLIDYREHHDARVVWNPTLKKHTLMFIANKKFGKDYVLNAGQNPEVRTFTEDEAEVFDTDVIAEVDIETGALLWEWWSGDHLIQNYDSSARNYAQDIADEYYGGDLEETFYRRTDINQKNNQHIYGLREDFFHTNSFDYNPDRDEIVLNSRTFSEFFVIDHSKTTEELKGKAGDFLWRFGSPSNYASVDQLGEDSANTVPYPGQMDPGYDQIYGAHDVHWIPEGDPGAGHFLIYDNGIYRPTYQSSAVLEINPYDDNGNYIRELDAGYNSGFMYPGAIGQGTFMYNMALLGGMDHWMRPSKLLAWAFTSNPWNFYGPHISGCQRLPNGNTIICDGPNGHFFEVTPAGQVVWEYTSPLFGSTFAMPTTKWFGGQGVISIGATDTVGLTHDGKEFIGNNGGNHNAVFRCYRISPDSPALKGKTLAPQGTVLEYVNNGNSGTFTGFGFGGGIGGSGGGGAGGGGGGAGGGGY